MDLLHAHILDAASRAPSAHNTQPWKLKLTEGSLEVWAVSVRSLPACDLVHSDLLHSVGAMLENVILALAELGFKVSYSIAPQFNLGEPVIHMKWTREETENDNTELYRMIPIRRTSRIPYEDRGIDPLIFQEARNLIDPGCGFFVTVEEEKIRKIRNLAARATLNQMGNIALSKELYRWMRFSKKDRRWWRDGLNAECMGLGHIESLVASIMLRPKFLRFSTFLRLNKLIFGSLKSLAPKCPAICLLTVANDNLQARIEAGRNLQRLWLFLASRGLVTHPISAAVDLPETRGEVMTLLGVPRGHRHVNLFRTGYSKPVARSPRLPVDEIKY